MRAAKVQASLRIRAVLPEPPLLDHTSSESRGTFRQKARALAPLNGWACAVKICHDGMLEDTNSLDRPHMGRAMRKCVLCLMRTTKAQISLRICAVWSAPLLFAPWIVSIFRMITAIFFCGGEGGGSELSGFLRYPQRILFYSSDLIKLVLFWAVLYKKKKKSMKCHVSEIKWWQDYLRKKKKKKNEKKIKNTWVSLPNFTKCILENDPD